MGVLYTAFGVAFVIATVIAGIHIVTRDPKKPDRSKMTDADVKLYRDAAKLLNRLIHVTDLEGDLAADMVSPATRRQIDQWLVAYKKEIEKL